MKLYKYLTLDGAKAVLKTQTLGFSLTSDFNDPFDRPIHASSSVAREDSPLFDGLHHSLKDALWAKSTAMLCLTRTSTNALMWAHYADSHRGVVLEIDCEKAGLHCPETNMIPAHFGSVVYAKHRPYGRYESGPQPTLVVGDVYHFVLERYERWQRLFLTKPLDWAYEEEVRIAKCVANLNKSGTSMNKSGKFSVIKIRGRHMYCYHIPKNAISKIILGIRFDQNKKEEFINLTKETDIINAKADQYLYSINC